MFMGHYAAAYVARAIEPRLPLGAAFLAVQLVDVAWGVFVLTGLERSHLDPSLPSNPLVLEHVPFTHSVLGTVGFAAVGYAAGRGLGASNRVALAFAGAVLSHWLLDLLVHRPDLTLFGTPPFLGLRLWDWPVAALVVELGVLIGAAFAHYRKVGGTAALQGGLLAFLVTLQIVSWFGPLPPSIVPVAASAVGAYLLLPALAAWLERRERSGTAASTS